MLNEAECVLDEPTLVASVDHLAAKPKALHLPVVLLAHGPASLAKVPVDHLKALEGVGCIVVQVVVAVHTLLGVIRHMMTDPRIVGLHLLVKGCHD